jgi:hypothetical protein
MSGIGEISEKQLPRVIRTFLLASNNHDTDMMLSCIDDDSVIVDDYREFRGKEAITKWSDEEFIGARVNVQVTNLNLREDQYLVSTEVNGDYPACPYYFNFCFTLQHNRISKLQISELK